MSEKGSRGESRAIVEGLEGRRLLSVSPSLSGQHTFPTHTVLKVEAGALGQPITFHVIVAGATELGRVDLYYRGTVIQELATAYIPNQNALSPPATEATYTIPAGPAAAQMFGVGPHAVRARFLGAGIFEEALDYPRSGAAVFRVKPPQFVKQPSGVGTATVSAGSGSGPALAPGQTATVQYNAYVAATYRLFYSTESQTPDTTSFVVDASPEQVIPGLDAGVVGMQAGETRAIYVPYKLAHGPASNAPPRAHRVYLVTLVSIG